METMDRVKMAQEKFIMLGQKLWLPAEMLEEITESFNKAEWLTEWKVTIEKREVDISKPVTKPYPSEEEVDKMGKEELAPLVKELIKEVNKEDMWVRNWQEHSPYVVMMKRKGY